MVQDARVNRCDFICMPMVKATQDLGAEASIDKFADTTALSSETAVLSGDMPAMNIVGLLSTWIDLDAATANHRSRSEKAFKEQIAYAAHLGLPAVIVPRLGYDSVNVWAVVHQQLLALSNMQMWVWVPLTVTDVVDLADGGYRDPALPSNPERDTWRWWDRFRTACEHIPNLGVVLELTAQIPDPVDTARWLGEPVRALSMSTSIFLTNKMGQPVLSRVRRPLLFCHVIFYPCCHPGLGSGRDITTLAIIVM
jgi:protein arginine N-methyltransferase 5